MRHTERGGSGGFGLILAFVGGALVGGVAAVLFAPSVGADLRRRIGGAVGDTKDVASRVPKALREATSAAQAAFAAALEESVGEDAAALPPGSQAHHDA